MEQDAIISRMNKAKTSTDEPHARSWSGALAVFVATGFGVGLVPFAPGTVGSLWGLPLAWAVGHLPVLPQIIVIGLIFIAGVPICTAAARYMGGLKDPGSIVLDEIASFPVVFCLMGSGWSWKLALAGFVLHRLFDITKPPPARQLERLPEGLGIMADDFAAAVYANLALRLVIWSGTL
jgi:phosphatidylglycerophosphatase A